MAEFFAIVSVLALCAILYLRRQQSAGSNQRPDERRKASTIANSKFHAVSIRHAEGACQAAKDMLGRRFLSTAAPRLPLPECDVSQCKCRFAHHDDRRSGRDRRNPWSQGIGADGTGRYAHDKRNGGDRRKTS